MPSQCDIKKIIKNDSITIYSAIWEDGPLDYDNDENEYIRVQDEKVFLKCSHDLTEILNKAKTYSIKKQYDKFLNILGISQNPYTEEYIMVLEDEYCENCGEPIKIEDTGVEFCKSCQINYLEKNFTNMSGNKIIDDFVQEMRLKMNDFNESVFEWIPNDQFYNIKEMSNNNFNITYLAKWRDGELSYKYEQKEWVRNPGNEVVLKYLYNSQNFTKESLNNEVCGNEEIDDLIHETQLRIDNMLDKVFEWIPYNQFSDIDEIEEGKFSALWKDGSLIYDYGGKKEWIRNPNKKVCLKYLYDSQNNIDVFLDEVKTYLTKELEEIEIHGISQDPFTNDYIIVLYQRDSYGCCEECGEEYNKDNEWCKKCQMDKINKKFLSWSGNKKIDDFVKELQSKIEDPDNNIIFEWIPYNQFSDIKEVGNGGFATVYSAIWKDGLLEYEYNYGWTRTSNTKVALKYLINSQDISDEFLSEVKAYSNHIEFDILKIFGISQEPSTKNYVMVLEYAEGGNFNDWMIVNHDYFYWSAKLDTLYAIISGLLKIHEKEMVHRDFHTGNILFKNPIFHKSELSLYISDMGLSGEAGNTDKTGIYGVLPYVAPEVLRGEPYTKASDIYSFGMIMYFTATGRQPFANREHDFNLTLDICKDNDRPRISEQEAPQFYIDLMKRCWDSDPDSRPDARELESLIFNLSTDRKIKEQLEEADEYDKAQSTYYSVIHSNAFYISRMLDTSELPGQLKGIGLE
ncbi:kinase-like domain-containing protein [Rhizophagus clarus]|uniref:Kinase-like domain-containing protein n=1 Tax=Rhizophagus clarus TaxID=94130 RepID=A0A8H3KTH0_9GLOM|nr:kinase-like domain-containing protein [Rhizophagus clarus]